ncbi:MAG TPA: DUF2007 domain-containing protein [Prolixibacteraceae bacterium]|jgi:hypothetical protein
MHDNKDEIIEVFCGTLWESQMITSLLKDAEIQSFLKNSILDSYAYDPIYATSVKVMILASDFERAQEIVDSYCRNSKSR